MMATLQEIRDYLTTDFHQVDHTVDEIGPGTATIRQKVGVNELRPGGTVSGPVMMSVADLAVYAAIFSELGIIPLAVTTNLNINFLRRPSPTADILGKCRLLKVGKKLVVAEINIYSEGSDDPVAHATATYALPPETVS
jgi:uncharacterized protein (TIGR00369 family)